MAVVPINPQEPLVELVDGAVWVRATGFTGTIVDVAHDLQMQDDPVRLGRLLTDAVEVGATVLRNGQSQALVEALALEIDRLIETATVETERIPQAFAEPLSEHMTQLADLLAEYFDPKRARSFPATLQKMVGEATGTELRKQVHALLAEDGTVGSQVRLVTNSNVELLTRVNTLLDKIEQKLQLDQAVERSSHKGRPFEEIVQAALEAIHAPLGDEVVCVRSEYGLLPKSTKGAKVGDFVVRLNPEHTRGHEILYVVEAKTGRLRAAEAKRELETAIKNRGATSGVLVFDDRDDAPLGGRSYMPHGDGRFTAVLEVEEGDTLAFEVACYEARRAAMTAERGANTDLDPSWLQSQCNRLCEAVEDASATLRHVGAIERGAGEIRNLYANSRREALELIDEIRERCA